MKRHQSLIINMLRRIVRRCMRYAVVLASRDPARKTAGFALSVSGGVVQDGRNRDVECRVKVGANPL
jgi:hypothetical protein